MEQDDELQPDPAPWHTGLNDRQRRFVEEYSLDWNATQAAVRAGYSVDTARQMGTENLSKPVIRAAIDTFLDLHTMSTGEALRRLTDMGRASIEPFIETYGRGFKLDLSTDEAKAGMHLIKEIGSTVNGPYIKLHDSKDAIFKLMQIRGKVSEKPADVTVNVVITPEDVAAFRTKAQDKY